MIFNPYPKQKRAIDLCVEHRNFALFADPGFGKTAVMLSVLNELLTAKVLIIAPLRVCYNVWPQEIEKWSNFHHYTVQILHGKKKKQLDQKADICIINSENIVWLMRTYKLDFDTLIIDESSQFKNFGSLRFMELRSRLDAFKNRFILTGTPIPNGLIDIFSQMFIIDETLLGDTITPFRQYYFYEERFKNFTKYKIRSEKDAQEIYDKIAPKCLRVDNSDVVLPELRSHTLYVELPEQVRVQYKQIEKDLFMEVEGEWIHKNVKYNSLRQICQGFLYHDQDDEQGPRTFDLHDEKLNALSELIDELGGKPILVAYHFKQDLAKLRKKWPKAPVIGGGVSQKKTTKIIKDWNEGKIQILFAHPQSMSMGLNLQHGPGRSICWYTLTDNLQDHIQYIKRLYRQGVKGDVNVYHIVARKTLDWAILGGLRSKEQTQESMLDAIEAYRKGL